MTVTLKGPREMYPADLDVDNLSWYDFNPYSSPQNFGLTIVDIIENGGGYDFDTTVLWKHSNGTFYIGGDSGCSCPTPFESHDFGGGIEPITSLGELDKYLGHVGGVSLAQDHDMRRKAQEAGLQ